MSDKYLRYNIQQTIFLYLTCINAINGDRTKARKENHCRLSSIKNIKIVQPATNKHIFFSIHQLKIISSKILFFECLLQPKQIDIQRKTEILFMILPTLGKQIHDGHNVTTVDDNVSEKMVCDWGTGQTLHKSPLGLTSMNSTYLENTILIATKRQLAATANEQRRRNQMCQNNTNAPAVNIKEACKCFTLF